MTPELRHLQIEEKYAAMGCLPIIKTPRLNARTTRRTDLARAGASEVGNGELGEVDREVVPEHVFFVTSMS